MNGYKMVNSTPEITKELVEMLEQIHVAEFGLGTWPTREEMIGLIKRARGAK